MTHTFFKKLAIFEQLFVQTVQSGYHKKYGKKNRP